MRIDYSKLTPRQWDEILEEIEDERDPRAQGAMIVLCLLCAIFGAIGFAWGYIMGVAT